MVNMKARATEKTATVVGIILLGAACGQNDLSQTALPPGEAVQGEPIESAVVQGEPISPILPAEPVKTVVVDESIDLAEPDAEPDAETVAETVEGLKAMADAAVSGTGPYSELPDYLYWKRDAGGRFTILNPNRKIAAPPDDTWIRQPFLIDLYDEVNTYDQWITRDWANYINGPVPGVVRYIFPIPAEAITNSQGTLKNDGYLFN